MPSVRPQTKKQNRSQRKKPRAVHRVLVIECDAARIRGQGFDVARTIVASTMVSGIEVVHVTIDLASDFDDAMRVLGRKRFAAIALVGHANQDGMGITSKWLMPWREVGDRFARLKPRNLLVLACRAGLPKVGAELFDAVATLERVYACPLPLSFKEAKIVSLFSTLMLSETPVDAGLRKILQTAHLVANDGLFFELRREDLSTPEGRANAEFETVMMSLLREVVRDL